MVSNPIDYANACNQPSVFLAPSQGKSNLLWLLAETPLILEPLLIYGMQMHHLQSILRCENVIGRSCVLCVYENNEPQDFEPVVNLLADSTEAGRKEGNPVTSSKPSTENVGLVSRGGLPTIPADIFTKINTNHYEELSELFLEKSRTPFSTQP